MIDGKLPTNPEIGLPAERGVPLRRHSARIDIQFNGGQSLEERLDDRRINPVGGNILADWHAVLLAERVAEVEGSAFVLDHHFMATLPAIE